MNILPPDNSDELDPDDELSLDEILKRDGLPEWTQNGVFSLDTLETYVHTDIHEGPTITINLDGISYPLHFSLTTAWRIVYAARILGTDFLYDVMHGLLMETWSIVQQSHKNPDMQDVAMTPRLTMGAHPQMIAKLAKHPKFADWTKPEDANNYLLAHLYEQGIKAPEVTRFAAMLRQIPQDYETFRKQMQRRGAKRGARPPVAPWSQAPDEEG